MLTEERIWNKLLAAGMTPAGAAGSMGNQKAESGLNSRNLQNSFEKKLGYNDGTYTMAVNSGAYTNFANDGAGYGLCQWTHPTRKAALLAFACAAGKSIGDEDMQVDFFIKELKESYPKVWAVLTTTKSIREASDAVLLNYERPADQSEAVRVKRAGYGQTYYDKYAEKGSGETMGGKITTGKQLAEAALNVAKNYKTLYVMGCFGAPMTAANKKRYTKNNPYNTAADRVRMINAASADTFGFDCVCLIKGLLWGWSGDGSKSYGGAGYAVNGVPDIGADTMITKCSGVTTDFSKIEVGEAVWCKGHIGIYIGGGLAVECTPKWKNCVQVTACNCDKSGYNRRNWTKHGKLPYVTYTSQSESVTGGTATTTPSPSTTKPAAPSVKIEAAKCFDKKLAGAYKTTDDLNLRAGAGTGNDKTVLVVVPKGGTVRNYGYYNTVSGKKWLYVQYTAGGKTYTGYCSMAYLKK